MTQVQHSLLLPIYGLTGCDSVSAFFGHGKKKAFKIMMKEGDKFRAMESLGDSLVLNQAHSQSAAQFVCTLYGDDKEVSLNALRCAKADKGIAAKRLPPTENSFALHLLCCMYQLHIWKKALLPMIEIPPATQFGYDRIDGGLSPTLMSQAAAAPELLNNIVCDCSDTCDSNCSCSQNSQPCTGACPCEAEDTCLNVHTLEVITTLLQYDSKVTDISYHHW
jgi:hypothetical protein